MKTAIYIENGVTQLVLTPESDWEKQALKAFAKETDTLKIYRGSFFRCQGGWNRYEVEGDDSIMLRLAAPEPYADPQGGQEGTP
jgi:hypothetical protein